MPIKRRTRGSRKNKLGGEEPTTGSSDWFDSIKSGVSSMTAMASSAAENLQKKATGSYANTNTATYPTSSYPTSTYPTSTGGKRRGSKKHRYMKGGNFDSNTPTSGLAFTAAPISGIETTPVKWYGGKTRKRSHRYRKSCKNGKSCKHRKSRRDKK